MTCCQRYRNRLFAAGLITLLALSSAMAQGPVGEPSGVWRDQIHFVPMRDKDGIPHLLYTRICRPRRETPARVVLINHGSPPDPGVRPRMQPATCESEAVQWFLTRGYLVVIGMRRGYGATGGVWAEGNGGACSAENYQRAGLEGVRDLEAIVSYATMLPYARPDGAVSVGQSAGGWATDAYDSVPHPKVVAMVSMAGGRGGHYNNASNNNCRPDELARAAGMFGRTASTPMLWVYAANDSFFAPAIATAMHAAFTAAGGKAELVQPGAFGNDGHGLFFGRGGSAIWGPLMERYLASRQAGP
jgi:dienelactone hydrolase